MRRVIVAMTLSACARASSSLPAPVASVDAAPAPHVCAKPVEIVAALEGSWFGNATSESMGPALVVRLADATLASPSAREVARIAIPQPFFAADVKLDELCSDEGSTPTRLEVHCVTRDHIASVVVTATDAGLTYSLDGAPPKSWNDDHGCYTLQSKPIHRDLEPARAAWGRDVPETKCTSTARSLPVKVALDFPEGTDEPICGGGEHGPANTVGVLLSIPSTQWKTASWAISNMCGGLHLTRYDDAEALLVETSDTGTEYRFFYRLGDRLYYVDDLGQSVSSTNLPCGAHVTFDIHYRWRSLVVEARGSMKQE